MICIYKKLGEQRNIRKIRYKNIKEKGSENEILGNTNENGMSRGDRRKRIIYEDLLRFVRNKQISERARWERSHNLSLTKSRLWLTISKVFVKSSVMMEVRRLSILRSTMLKMWSNFVVVLWDRRKRDWQEGEILKFEIKTLSYEKQIHSSSFKRKRENEIGKRRNYKF